MTKDVINYVQYQMQTDDSVGLKENLRIAQTYQDADEKTKKVIDDIFISLCGYSLATVLDNADELEEEE